MAVVGPSSMLPTFETQGPTRTGDRSSDGSVQENPGGMREFTLTDPSGTRFRIGAGRADQRRRVKLAIPEPGPAGLRPPAIQTDLLPVVGVDENQTLGAVAPRTPGVPRVDCH